MLGKSIVVMALVLGVVALAAVAWAGAAGPNWYAGPAPMMGSDEPGPGAWDEGDWEDMAQWMEQMHGTGPGAGDEESWQGMAERMEQVHQRGSGLCPHWGYALPGANETPGT